MGGGTMSAAISIAFLAGCFATLAVIAVLLLADGLKSNESASYDDWDGGGL
jgi:hypothetical protein